jgi:ubiquinone/menaquinone biosynthesis C-methylase UbiE
MNEDFREFRHPVTARLYARYSRAAEARGNAEIRDRLLAGLHGEIIEIGAGHGLNFGHYPHSVTEVLAVEPEPYLRQLAELAARSAPVPVRVVAGAAGRLPCEDSSKDAAVLSLVLCSISDPQLALAEIMRVLRPGGEVRFYEHVVSSTQARARVQRLLDATLYPRLSGGCHLARDSRKLIEDAGFSITQCGRFMFPAEGRIRMSHILGIARKPPCDPHPTLSIIYSKVQSIG